jgi:spermidine synthase
LIARGGAGTLPPVKPWEIVERAPAAQGAEFQLARRDDEWVVRVDGQVLMTSRTHGSEELMAKLAIERLERPRSILIGGLGMGFSVRAALDNLPAEAQVIVAELSKQLVRWNRGPLADLAGRPLEDPRVKVQVGDVLGRISEAHGAWDAILLDVDNGPRALSQPYNQRLYGERGLVACRGALRSGGVLAVWSAGPDERFLARMGAAGFEAEALTVPARPGSGARHVVFLGKLRSRPRS